MKEEESKRLHTNSTWKWAFSDRWHLVASVKDEELRVSLGNSTKAESRKEPGIGAGGWWHGFPILGAKVGKLVC